MDVDLDIRLQADDEVLYRLQAQKAWLEMKRRAGRNVFKN
jgi:hypothetical protein|tara:strand:+ start:25998 stop:26117 length:120 start_codon:yes stop_codon:yes gene_type:complete